MKYAQTNYLLKRVGAFLKKVKDQHVKDGSDPAVIICGDFNSFPHSSSVSLIYDTQDYAKNRFYGKDP